MGLGDSWRPGRDDDEPDAEAERRDGFTLEPPDEEDAGWILSLYLGALPTDAVVTSHGDEPNGAFWDGVAAYAAPDLAARLAFDSEGSMFEAEGSRDDVTALRGVLTPLVHDAAAMEELLRRAAAEGIVLEEHGR